MIKKKDPIFERWERKQRARKSRGINCRVKINERMKIKLTKGYYPHV